MWLARRKIIENRDLFHGGHSEEPIDCMASYEACPSGNKCSHASLL